VEVKHVGYLKAYGLRERVEWVYVVLSGLRLRRAFFRHARGPATRAEEFI